MGKREEILESSLNLFATEGYENVGIQKIVTTCGVTKPTLYHYFGSKQGLLTSLLNFYYTPFLKKLEKCSSYQGDIVLTIESIAMHYFQFERSNPKIDRFMLSLLYSSKKSEARRTAQPFTDREFGLIESVFKEAEQDHGNMKGRSYNYTISFLGMIKAYITGHLVTESSKDNEMVHALCRQYMYGIFS